MHNKMSLKKMQELTRTGQGTKFFKVRDIIYSSRAYQATASIGNSTGITAAAIDYDTFVKAVPRINTVYEFFYDGNVWNHNGVPCLLATYGLSVTGNAVSGDVVIVTLNADKLGWDILGTNHDTAKASPYTTTLGMHDQWKNDMQFDAPEAMFAFSSGLAAGTYNFTVGAQPWYASDVNKTMQFTLTKAIPAGGQLRTNNAYNATMIGSTVLTYSSPSSTTALETVSITQGNSGTSLGTVTRTVTGNINSIDRALLGSNNYKESAIRQWLNSDKPAGQVWTPQTVWDRPPSWAATADGFMRGMDADFLAVVGKTHIKVARATTYEGGVAYDEMDDYFFLLSRSEQYGGVEVSGVDEGSPYPYYSDYSDLSSAGTGADKNRIKYRNGTAQLYWERTPYTSSGYNVCRVGADGYVSGGNAYISGGVLPACNII